MTKYILIGGSQDKSDKVKLGKAVFNDNIGEHKLLICLFARNQNVWNWEELFKENARFLKCVAPDGAKIQFSLATEKAFEKQLTESDIIYFSGGDSIPLYSALARIGNNWTKNLDKKVVIGTSASTDMLSKYNFDIQQGRLDRGLGLASVKTIVHYNSLTHQPRFGWDNAVKELRKYGEELPIFLLREGDFRVYEDR